MCKLIERIINVWNVLPHTVDFSSLSKFKQSLNRVDFSAFLRYEVMVMKLKKLIRKFYANHISLYGTYTGTV